MRGNGDGRKLLKRFRTLYLMRSSLVSKKIHHSVNSQLTKLKKETANYDFLLKDETNC